MAEKQIKPKWLCLHCGDEKTAAITLCGQCKTPEKRAAMDAENTEIFAARGMKFVCEYCTKEKRNSTKSE